MRIVFDGRYIRTDHHDGISKFSARLIEFMAPLLASRGIAFTVLINDARQAEQFPASITSHLVSAPTSIREPWVAKQVNVLQPDVVFSPMQTMGSRGRRYKLVLTIHDLIYYAHPTPPRQFNVAIRALWRLYHLSWWPQRYLLSKADAVVAVSETTKNLISQNNLTSKPVYVVHNAADVDLSDSDNTVRASSRVLVYMGSFMPYKNVDTLVRAAALLPSYELHLLSRISSTEQTRLTELAPSARLVFHNGCSDEEYRALLHSAHALMMASRDEGFGIPVVEAMAAGTPVVLSDIDIFHEVAGDAGIFASDSSESFAQAVTQLEDEQLWAKLSSAGKRRAAEFSWKRSATELVDVLVNIARTSSTR